MRFIATLALAMVVASTAFAVSDLPYSTRTRGYSGYSSTVQGDLRTVGLAGAMVGVADTYLASASNPAGLAMTLPSVALQLSSTKNRDRNIQDFDQPIETGNYGVAGRFYPWGFSIGENIPYREGQDYRLPTTGQVSGSEISVSELTFSAARLFFRDRLSLGVNLVFGSARRRLDSIRYDSSLVSANVGAMIQLPGRVLLGLTYALPKDFGPADDNPAQAAAIPGFNRPVHQPWRLGLGVGWIPNRSFLAGFSLYAIGSSEDAALLRDDSLRVGEKTVLQPRLGLNYTAVELKELKVFLMGGTYYEVSRVKGAPDRLHWTGGVDINVWLFNIGIATDQARGFSNQIFSVAIDIIRTSKKLDFIPAGYQPEPKGFFPAPTKWDDDDLPRPLVRNYVEKGQTPDLIQITKEIPKRVTKKLREVGKEVEEGVESVLPLP